MIGYKQLRMQRAAILILLCVLFLFEVEPGICHTPVMASPQPTSSRKATESQNSEKERIQLTEEESKVAEDKKRLLDNASSLTSHRPMKADDPRTNVPLSNDYLSCVVDSTSGRFTIGTTGGNPDTSTDDSAIMLYGHPQPRTSYTTIYVDGHVSIYGQDGFSEYPHNEGLSNSSTTRIGNLEVQQKLTIMPNVATQREDIVRIQYTLTNHSADIQTVGLRIMLDTMLGSNDSAPFRIPQVGEVTTEHEFTGANIPPSFQAFDSLSSPKVVSYGSLLAGSIRPNKVQFTNWSRVYNQYWGYQIHPGMKNGDSAVSIIWERTLAPGDVETYETRYGLSALVQDLLPPLETTISGDAEVTVDAATKEYAPYPLTIDIQNVGEASAKNVVVDIDLPDELQAQDGQPLRITFPEIKPREIKKIERVLLVKKLQKASKEVEVKVGVKADNVDAKLLSKKITIPANRRAIIILPGIAASRMFGTRLSDKVVRLWEPQKLGKPWLYVPYLACNQRGEPFQRVELEHSVLRQDGTRDWLQIGQAYAQYGALSTYTSLVSAIYEEFSRSYDIYFFSYDWRLSNTKNAEYLENFINAKDYTKVDLVAHSMGGLLASEYLRRNSANQQKVNRLITIGTPYLGAPKTLYALETGNFLGMPKDIVYSIDLRGVIHNFGAVYELLPSQKYFELNKTKYVTKVVRKILPPHREPTISIKRTKLNYQETYDLIASRDWARTILFQVKPMLEQSKIFHERLIHNDHVISKANYYAILGYGIDTIMEVEEEYQGRWYKRTRDITIANSGDGTVPLISANIGGTVAPSRDFYVNDKHTDLVKNLDVIEFVINLLHGDLTHASSIHDDPPGPINAKGWIPTTEPTIKLRVACPVTLSLLDEKGTPWAEASNESIMNQEPDQGSFYTLGEDNEIKIAFLHQNENHILLTGTDSGVMTYTASVLESGYETKRVIFHNVPITKTTKIYTDTNFQQGLSLELDEDGDGKIDRVIEPTASYEGKDLEEEIDIDPEAISNYGLISKSEGISMNLAAKQLTIDSNLYSSGILSLTGMDIKKPDIIHAKSIYQNGIKQPNQEILLEENLEEDLKAYVGKSIPYETIKEGRVIGKTTYVKGDHFTLDHSFKVKDHLRYNTTDFTSDKPIILASEEGDISIIARDNFDFTGIIYAPNGTVTITGKDIKLNGVILANRIYITGEKMEILNPMYLDERK